MAIDTAATIPQKTCFVVMGFGAKTDFQSNPQRVLDLDKTYRIIIKPAVEAANVKCIRADEVIHSGVIDLPMYEQLLNADVVVADLSTSNPNAIYELGVRHALRPHTTIIMAENQFMFPFDIKSISILKYEHLGKGIDAEEAEKMKSMLTQKIAQITQTDAVDSPVYTFLPSLRRPTLAEAGAAFSTATPPAGSPVPLQPADQSLAALMASAEKAKADIRKPVDWLKPAAILDIIRAQQPNDAYVLQQLALATYKSEQPTVMDALVQAKEILKPLEPDASCDAETVGLWGAIHKRLWENGKNRPDLDAALRAYARGYYIKNDYYNGINYAFLLDLQASVLEGDEAVANRCLAKRVRKDVLELCGNLLKSPSLKQNDVFWIKATQVEALLGIGSSEAAETLRKEVIVGADGWMVDALDKQLKTLKGLLG